MIEKVKRYIEQHNMIARHDQLVVGVSGGADSVCLLYMLLEFCSVTPISLYVVHINHGLRGEEALRDAAYVRQICTEQQLPFYLYEEDVNSYATEHGLTTEEAGRIIRYRAFAEVKKQVGAGKIALAHHKNDQAETVLFRLFRGSGIKGLGGMSPVRDDVIRPLLCLERSEIEQYLKKRNLSYCIDSTNNSDHYARNIIRNRILPVIEDGFHGQVVAHIAETATFMQEAEQYIYKQALSEFMTKVTGDIKTGYHIPLCLLRASEPVIQQYLVRIALERLAQEWKDIGIKHIRDILKLQDKEVSKVIMLPRGLTARRDYQEIVLSAPEDKEAPARLYIPINTFPTEIKLMDGVLCSVWKTDKKIRILSKKHIRNSSIMIK